MTDGLTSTETRPDPETTRPADAPDLAAFWTALSEMAAAHSLRSRAARALRVGAPGGRPGDGPPVGRVLYDRVTAEVRILGDELRGLAEAVRGLDVGDWTPAARGRVVTRWYALRGAPTPLPAAARDDVPSADDDVPGSPPTAPQWSAVIAQHSSLATRRHYCLPPSPQVAVAPPPRPPLPVLTRSLAVAVAVAASSALAVAATTGSPSAVVPPRAAPAPTVAAEAAPSSAAAPTRASTLSATAPKAVGHAEFHRDTGRFTLYDDRRDGRSAVLQFTVDGGERQTGTNAKGITDATHPPEQFPARGLTAASSVAFRVCTAPPGTAVKEQSCGAWTRDPAS